MNHRLWWFVGGGVVVTLVVIGVVWYMASRPAMSPAVDTSLSDENTLPVPADQPIINQPVPPSTGNVTIVYGTATPEQELEYLKNATVETPPDTDGDGLSDGLEPLYGTDVNNPDTDGDGYKDGAEVNGGYNPLGGGRGIKVFN